VGGRGGAALAGLAGEQFVALCDVDEKRSRAGIAGGKKAGPPDQLKDAKWFKDFRLMFEQMADKIDAVAIATPDHMHFPIAMAAIAAKKHVYVEKPMCRCLTEVRRLHASAQAAGVVTQMGNQGRAAEGIRLAREWVQALTPRAFAPREPLLLPARILTLACADCGVLRERCWEWDYVFTVAENGGG
jgi:predicted dehydrogenase